MDPQLILSGYVLHTGWHNHTVLIGAHPVLEFCRGHPSTPLTSGMQHLHVCNQIKLAELNGRPAESL